jgi:hypothetical protein
MRYGCTLGLGFKMLLSASVALWGEMLQVILPHGQVILFMCMQCPLESVNCVLQIQLREGRNPSIAMSWPSHMFSSWARKSWTSKVPAGTIGWHLCQLSKIESAVGKTPAMSTYDDIFGLGMRKCCGSYHLNNVKGLEAVPLCCCLCRWSKIYRGEGILVFTL